MSLTKDEKVNILKDFGVHEGDTGSDVVQIALLTRKIQKLTEHLKEHKKDFHSRRGLLIMVGRRRKFLNYLKKNNQDKYQEVLKRLELRK